MEELKEGYVPTELRKSHGAKGANVSLEDKRGE